MKTKGRGRPSSRLNGDGCALCGFHDDDPALFGEKLKVDKLKLSVHYFCLLTSCGLHQRGAEDEGVFGFLIEDIVRERRRSGRLTCSVCKQKGACVGCFVPRCRKKVHFPCGRRQRFLSQFSCPFPSFCPDHAPTQSLSPGLDLSLPRSCSVCLEELEPELSYDVLKCPECHSSWFHRDCVQRQAHSSGLFFFRCTLCNNKEQFQKEMLRMGIHIPERDASWELESGAFEELLEVYSHCDAEECVCSEGRQHSAKTGYLEIIRCRLCGSRGTHRKCSALRPETKDWACPDCTQAIDGKPALMASPNVHQRRRLSRHRLSSAPPPVSNKRPCFSAASSPEASARDLLRALLPKPRPLQPEPRPPPPLQSDKPRPPLRPVSPRRGNPSPRPRLLPRKLRPRVPRLHPYSHKLRPTTVALYRVDQIPSAFTQSPLADRPRPHSPGQGSGETAQSPLVVVVEGEAALSAALELLRRPDFDPAREISVRFAQFPSSPSGAEASEASESSRQLFLKLLLRQIQDCEAFEGAEGKKNLALNAQALKEDLYFEVGALLALVLVHGLSPLRFFSPALFQLLFNFPQNQGLTLDHLTPGSPLSRTINKIQSSASESELRSVLSSVSDHLTLSGCNRPIRSLEDRGALVDDLIAFTMITRMQLPLQRFREGLQTLGVFEQVQLYPSVFLPFFTAVGEDEGEEGGGQGGGEAAQISPLSPLSPLEDPEPEPGLLSL